MKMKEWASAFIDFFSDHSTEVAAGAAILGVIATAILAAKPASEAEDVLDDAKEKLSETNEPEKKKEIKKACGVKLVKLYLPAFVSGTLTIICIVLSVKEGHKHQAAAIASACSASQTALLEYKEKAKEILGEKEANKVEDAIAEDRAKNIDESRAIRTGLGDDLVLEGETGQLLYSDMEYVRREWNDFALAIDDEDGQSLMDWIRKLKGEDSELAEDYIWKRESTNDRFRLIERPYMTRNKKVCYVISYDKPPRHYKLY